MSISLTSCPKEDIVNRIRNWRTLLVTGLLGIVALSAFSANALWSDTQTVAGNKVQAGTIDISVADGGNCPNVSNVITAGVGGLLPGERGDEGHCLITNNGSRELQLYVSTNNFADSVCQYIRMHAAGNGSTFGQSGNLLSSPGWQNAVFVNPTTVVMQPGQVMDFKFTPELDVNTPQSEQGNTCTFELVFKGEQVAP